MGLNSIKLGPLFMGDLRKDLSFSIRINNFKSYFMHFFNQVILDIENDRQHHNQLYGIQNSDCVG
jgi:hypothetical protein